MVSEEFLMRELITSWNEKICKLERDVIELKRLVNDQSIFIHDLDERVKSMPV